ALDRVDAAKIEAANDSIYRVQQAAKGAGQQFAVALAPYIEAAAKWLLEAAKQAGGFRKIATNAVEGVVTVLGYMRNALHVVEVGWLAIKTTVLKVWSVVAQAYATIFGGIEEQLGSLINGAAAAVNKLVGVFGEFIGIDIPKIEFQVDEGFLQRGADNLKSAYGEAVEELKTEMAKEWPADGLRAAFEEVRQNAEKAAEKVASVKPGGVNFDGGAGVSSTAPQDEFGPGRGELDAYKAQLGKRIDALAESQRTEAERLQVALDNRSAMLEDAFQRGLIDDQRRNELLLNEETSYQERMNKLVEEGSADRAALDVASTNARVKGVLGKLNGYLAGVGGVNKKMFKLQKAAALAHAAVRLPETVMDAYAWGNKVGGPWTGAAMAALAGAAQLANIQRIRSSSFGGGASSGSGGGGGGGSLPSNIGNNGASQAQQPQTQQAPQITIHVAEGGVIVGNPEQVAQLVAQGLSTALENDLVTADVDIRVVA
ncbi:MAG: hypothetical protein ACPGSW_10645, partial [Phaeobacter italicus]